MKKIRVIIKISFLVIIFSSLLVSCKEKENVSEVASPESTESATATYERVAPKEIVSFAEAVKVASGSVVNVFTTKEIEIPKNPLFEMFFEDFYGKKMPKNKQKQTSLGSGVIYRVSEKNVLVITNNHVVAGAKDIVVAIGGTEHKAEIIGSDSFSDLAVLELKDVKEKLTPITLASGFEVGDVVLAIGNPFGVGKTVSQGIVGATGRDNLGITRFENFIQTDAAINPGNSGGALVNSLGELVGINTAIFSQSGGNQGVGFAIPFDIVENISNQLIETGQVLYPWAGLILQPLSPNLIEAMGLSDDQKGALVSGTATGGPAEKAGVQAGDIIVEFAGKMIVEVRDINTIINKQKINSKVDLKLLRDKQEYKFSITLESRPKEEK